MIDTYIGRSVQSVTARLIVTLVACFVSLATSCGRQSVSLPLTSLCYQLIADGGTPDGVGPEIRLGQATVASAVTSLNQDASDVAAGAAKAREDGHDDLAQDALTLSAAVRAYATDLPAQNPATEIVDLERINVADNRVGSDCSSAAD